MTDDLIQSDLKSILGLITTMNKHILRLESKIDKLESNKITPTSSVISSDTKPLNTETKPRIFKKEKFDIDEDKVRGILEKANQAGDYEMFKIMYLKTEKFLYPIRKIKSDYQYWDGTDFKSDLDGEFIKSVITSNIRHCYVKVNKYSDMSIENADKFIKNQEHIEKLNDPKYMNKLFDNIFKKL